MESRVYFVFNLSQLSFREAWRTSPTLVAFIDLLLVLILAKLSPGSVTTSTQAFPVEGMDLVPEDAISTTMRRLINTDCQDAAALVATPPIFWSIPTLCTRELVEAAFMDYERGLLLRIAGEMNCVSGPKSFRIERSIASPLTDGTQLITTSVAPIRLVPTFNDVETLPDASMSRLLDRHLVRMSARQANLSSIESVEQVDQMFCDKWKELFDGLDQRGLLRRLSESDIERHSAPVKPKCAKLRHSTVLIVIGLNIFLLIWPLVCLFVCGYRFPGSMSDFLTLGRRFLELYVASHFVLLICVLVWHHMKAEVRKSKVNRNRPA